MSPEFDITLRVGCSLAYTVTGTASLLLHVKTRADPGHAVVFEALTLGNDLPSEEFIDDHGNPVMRITLAPGENFFRHDAIIATTSRPDNADLPTDARPLTPGELPHDLLRYTLPSRYCDSDKLSNFAWQMFGWIDNGMQRVHAICDWVHQNIEYRYGSGRPDISASEVVQRGYGVCRDFAHVVVALCRAFNMPARYVTGHLPDIAYLDSGSPMDFHAYGEVFLGQWFTIDARFNVPRIGRIKLGHGMDAVDGAFSTIYGQATLVHFMVWAYQVNPLGMSLGDPIDLSKRLDGTPQLRFA